MLTILRLPLALDSRIGASCLALSSSICSLNWVFVPVRLLIAKNTGLHLSRGNYSYPRKRRAQDLILYKDDYAFMCHSNKTISELAPEA